tara:strand:+ start:1612 stop:2190 length:579 start_codon:yes stop_codon:yes gene_type:complete
MIKEGNSFSFYSNYGVKEKEILTDSLGHIYLIKTFKDGSIDSEWLSDTSGLISTVEYYSNGKPKIEGYLKDNKKHSVWNYYNRSGHLEVKRYFSYDVPSNIWIWYNHDNHGIDHYTIYTDIRDDGVFKKYYKSGQLKEQKKYSNNKLNGSYTLYYDDDNNTKKLVGEYLNNLKVGEWDMFDLDGIFIKTFFK